LDVKLCDDVIEANVTYNISSVVEGGNNFSPLDEVVKNGYGRFVSIVGW